jgi:hypothetical protein
VTKRRALAGADPALIEARLRDAYVSRLCLSECDPYLGIAIPRLAAIAHRGPAGPSDPFGTVGARRTKAELEAVAKAAEANDVDDLHGALTALHAPAIAALARLGVVRHLAPHLEDLTARAREAAENLPPLPAPPGGRPRYNLANVVATCVIEDFERLTGEVLRHAGIDRREGVALVAADVFGLMAISANPRAAVARALTDRARRLENP